MSVVLVTGSSDGIGERTADRLAQLGHDVVRHARDEDRADRIRQASPDPREVAVGDFTSLAQTRSMADGLAGRGIDVVVHNAGWGAPSDRLRLTGDDIEPSFQIHVLAPYVLTAVLGVGRRLVYVSSDSIVRATLDVPDLASPRSWSSGSAYANSKLAGTALTFALARRYPHAAVNAVHPGWVRTKMSGDEAPLSVEQGADTPVWLASGDDPAARVSGRFFVDRRVVELNPAADDPALQDRVVDACAHLTGLALPS